MRLGMVLALALTAGCSSLACCSLLNGSAQKDLAAQAIKQMSMLKLNHC